MYNPFPAQNVEPTLPSPPTSGQWPLLTDVDQLRVMPLGSVVLDSRGAVLEKMRHPQYRSAAMWHWRGQREDTCVFPAWLLWNPDWSKLEAESAPDEEAKA
ncbi:MAG: hypothetical protein WAV90_12045 [Gordonia amarae]